MPIATTQTHFSQALWEDPKQEAKIIKQVPLGRVGLVEDIAGAVSFLARFKILHIIPSNFLSESSLSRLSRKKQTVECCHAFDPRHCLVAVMMLIT